MLEVEVKYRARLSEVREALRGLGFSLLSSTEEVDIYFQHPCRDFSASDEALRVRVSGGVASVTYKGPRTGSEAKTRLEITASSGVEVVEVFKKLGFAPVATVRKRREYYRRGDILVSLDEVEGLGEFVEIEKAVADVGEVEGAVREVRELASALGLKEEVRETYLELFLKIFKSGS